MKSLKTLTIACMISNKTLALFFLGIVFFFTSCGTPSRLGYDRSLGGYPGGSSKENSRKSQNASDQIGEILRGEASYYGPGLEGNLTANGETFDPNQMTCAHKTLPFGTLLRVTRDDTGESVVVRVNDRGPYAKGRILDLSAAAGKKIGLDKSGHAQVTAEIIGNE